MKLALPYQSFDEIKFNNNETLNFAYFNSHIAKLFSNFDSWRNVQKIPVASTRNYGTARIAKVSDIATGTDDDGVVSINNFQEFLRSETDTQRKSFTDSNALSLNSDLIVTTGTITVPSGFFVGKSVTNHPSLVQFAHVSIEVPGLADGVVGKDIDASRFTCCENADTDTYPGISSVDVGKIRYDSKSVIDKKERRIFAFYRDGVVVVRNDAFDANKENRTGTIRVFWTLISRKR